MGVVSRTMYADGLSLLERFWVLYRAIRFDDADVDIMFDGAMNSKLALALEESYDRLTLAS